MLRFLFILLASSLPAFYAMADITLGEPLPPLTIDDRGELVLDDEEVRYASWQLPDGLGKPHVVQYMAGTMKARAQTRPFTDSLEASIPYEKIHVTTLINLDQALWGTTGFVVGKAKSNKRKYPASTIVLDEEGLGQEAWRLSPKQAAVVILDAGGSVLYFKEGAMSEEDIQHTLTLIRQHIEP